MNTQIPLAVINDGDFAKVIEKLGNILERLSSLETEVKSHAVIAGVVLTLLGYFGWKQVKEWIAEYARKETAKTTAKIEAKMDSEIAARANTLTETGSKLTAYVAEAADGLAKIRDLVEQARLAGNVAMVWESGENDIEFKSVNYINFWVSFKTKFPSTPQVFVAESQPGEWVYVKVDERFADRFRWAARSLSGLPIRHKTKIQWFAMCQQSPMGRPAADFEPVEAAQDFMRKLVDERRDNAQ